MADETQGNPAPNAGQGTDPPEGSKAASTGAAVWTEESIKALVNSAIGGRIKDERKHQEKFLGEFSTGLFSKLDETLAARFEAFKPAAPATEPAKKGDKVDAPPPLEETPQFKALNKQLAELTKKSADAEARAHAALIKELDSDLRAKAMDQLQKSGFDAPRAKIAIALLVDSTKTIGRDEDGKIVFRHENGDLDLGAGIKEWLKSDEGKALTPKRGAAGSGDGPRGQSGSPNGAGKQDPKALLRDGVNRLLGREPPRE